jgi:hypothetical protein
MIPALKPTTEFLIDSLVTGLLEHYQIEHPAVPVRRMVGEPPPDFNRDISLSESINFTFCRSVWIRPLDGQGVIFLNANLTERERRYELACSLFSGVCGTTVGHESGLYQAANSLPTSTTTDFASRFARKLLMPVQLLPYRWEKFSTESFADLFEVPVQIAHLRLQELLLN